MSQGGVLDLTHHHQPNLVEPGVGAGRRLERREHRADAGVLALPQDGELAQRAQRVVRRPEHLDHAFKRHLGRPAVVVSRRVDRAVRAAPQQLAQRIAAFELLGHRGCRRGSSSSSSSSSRLRPLRLLLPGERGALLLECREHERRQACHKRPRGVCEVATRLGPQPFGAKQRATIPAPPPASDQAPRAAALPSGRRPVAAA
eukprot:SAG22_NODE_430_length_10586_cov_6.817202_7_plen_202_part_00